MGVDEKERERAILDVTAQLLLRHGYNKVTMSDVADAASLNRRLVYLLLPSKDALIKALLLRELNIYARPARLLQRAATAVADLPLGWARHTSPRSSAMESRRLQRIGATALGRLVRPA